MSGRDERDLPELGELGEALERAGAFERELFEAARREGSAPGEDQAQAALRQALGEPAVPRRRRARGPWIALAAAAAIVCVLYFRPGSETPLDPPPPIPLGSGLELVLPEREGADFSRFEWRYDEECEYFKVLVYDGLAGPIDELTEPIGESGEVYSTVWEPELALRRKWPKKIVWTVTALDASNEPLASEFAEASASP